MGPIKKVTKKKSKKVMAEHVEGVGGGRGGSEGEMWLLRSVGEKAAGWRREGEQRHEDKCALSFPN